MAAESSLSMLDSGTSSSPDASRVLSLWKTVTEKLGPVSAVARETYEQRLRTFRPSWYFAKPASLSPLIASRFGWTNTAEDLLVCSECHAAVAITIHPNLSASGVKSVCRVYNNRLATSHASDCPFRFDAERCLLSAPNPQGDYFLVPSCFSNVFPQDTLQLMETPDPKPLLRKRIAKLVDSTMFSDNEEPFQIPNLVLSKDVQSFVPSKCDHRKEPRNDTEILDTLSKRVCSALAEVDAADESASKENLSGSSFESAAMLALFGWLPVSSKSTANENTRPTLIVECDVCLARAKLTMESTQKANDSAEGKEEDSSLASKTPDKENEGEGSPPVKKQRISNEQGAMNPLTSHRYYCPYVCGFHVGATPPSNPAWQTIASNLLQSEVSVEKSENATSNAGEEAFHSVRRILRAGIAKSKP